VRDCCNASTNILLGVADAIRTSLGPRGMDKMVGIVINQYLWCISVVVQIQNSGGDVTITNDGATILKQMQVLHPAARMVSSYHTGSI